MLAATGDTQETYVVIWLLRLRHINLSLAVMIHLVSLIRVKSVAGEEASEQGKWSVPSNQFAKWSLVGEWSEALFR